VIQRALCPVLVGRDEQLSRLEDALLSANRGESRFLALAGEAGLGKTRLATELVGRARKLGLVAMWGACSEAELSLPYLPFVEAVGNYVSTQDSEELARRLGPAASELAQVFPQLGPGRQAAQDPVQAKLRLFEAFVSLLALPAAEHGLLLVVEDIHWADSSTRELLDHLARRLVAQRALVLVTYRSDELDRRHPLLATLQGWRRSGAAEFVQLEPLGPELVGTMISAIFDTDAVGDDFRDLMHERSEGNPFVLEEMLKDTIDRGDVLRTGDHWEAKDVRDLDVPQTVRDTILLRLERLERDHVAVLQAAAVLGRSFDYGVLAKVAHADEEAVLNALEAAIAQQLIEEDPQRTGRFRWRHALTQEAIYDEIVLPRRQAGHSRAADALADGASGSSFERVHHLLEAGRFAEAVPACIEAADMAMRAMAYGVGVSLLERALPHVATEHERAGLLCRIGTLRWLNGEPSRAEPLLSDGIERLLELGEEEEAARARNILGRVLWEIGRSRDAMATFEDARRVLEPLGPSGDLALTYMRIASLHAFELDYAACYEAAQRAVDTAEAAGAETQRIWSLAFLGLGAFYSGDADMGFRLMDECFAGGLRTGNWWIAQNVTYNDVWTRVHLMLPGLEERVARADLLPVNAVTASIFELNRAYVARARGDLAASLEHAREGRRIYERMGVDKFAWRGRVLEAEALTELGELDEAEGVVPPVSARADLQDVVYDAPVQIRLALARGRLEVAAARAEEILRDAERLATLRIVHAYGVEAFVAAGRLEDARRLIDAGRAAPMSAGVAFVDEADGRLLLATGQPEAALAVLERAAEAASRAGYTLWEVRARILLGAAHAAAGRLTEARSELERARSAAHQRGARLLANEARATAVEHGVELAPGEDERPRDGAATVVPLGERLVTSMFADIRGYTPLVRTGAPTETADRLHTLYRWAKDEVERQRGIVDKFAGDAVMATFNVSGATVDHCVHALQAALALRDKAALMDLPIGVGIAVGPAVVGKALDEANLAVVGPVTNLAARLQAAAAGGEVVLSEEAYRRVEPWLAERGLASERELLMLKGFGEPQPAYRLPAPAAVSAS
jgi:class 3 adenylate cyclase